VHARRRVNFWVGRLIVAIQELGSGKLQRRFAGHVVMAASAVARRACPANTCNVLEPTCAVSWFGAAPAGACGRRRAAKQPAPVEGRMGPGSHNTTVSAAAASYGHKMHCL
jgi:hypothetical protein